MRKAKRRRGDAAYANQLKAHSSMYEAWERLKHRPAAMISLAGIILIVLLAVFADVLADYNTMAVAQNAAEKLQGPSLRHILGTDKFGRDLFARIIHGARIALIMGVGATFLSMLIAVILASLGALCGNKVDNIIMRVMDILSSIPGLVIALAICAGLGAGLWQLVVALTVQAIPYQTRMVRSRALSIAQNEYIEAARLQGAGIGHIIVRHLLPNLASIVIVTATGNVSYNILMGATLSFIGLGVAAPRPEWGLMLSESMTYMARYPYITIVPGCAIVLTALCINTFGDCLRDAFDPQLKGRA